MKTVTIVGGIGDPFEAYVTKTFNNTKIQIPVAYPSVRSYIGYLYINLIRESTSDIKRPTVMGNLAKTILELEEATTIKGSVYGFSRDDLEDYVTTALDYSAECSEYTADDEFEEEIQL